MTWLRLAYLTMAVGMMGFGALLTWLGIRRPSRPAGTPLRIVMAVAVLLAAVGMAVAVVLESQAARPW